MCPSNAVTRTEIVYVQIFKSMDGVNWHQLLVPASTEERPAAVAPQKTPSQFRTTYLITTPHHTSKHRADQTTQRSRQSTAAVTTMADMPARKLTAAGSSAAEHKSRS